MPRRRYLVVPICFFVFLAVPASASLKTKPKPLRIRDAVVLRDKLLLQSLAWLQPRAVTETWIRERTADDDDAEWRHSLWNTPPSAEDLENEKLAAVDILARLQDRRAFGTLLGVSRYDEPVLGFSSNAVSWAAKKALIRLFPVVSPEKRRQAIEIFKQDREIIARDDPSETRRIATLVASAEAEAKRLGESISTDAPDIFAVDSQCFDEGVCSVVASIPRGYFRVFEESPPDGKAECSSDGICSWIWEKTKEDVPRFIHSLLRPIARTLKGTADLGIAVIKNAGSTWDGIQPGSVEGTRGRAGGQMAFTTLLFARSTRIIKFETPTSTSLPQRLPSSGTSLAKTPPVFAVEGRTVTPILEFMGANGLNSTYPSAQPVLFRWATPQQLASEKTSEISSFIHDIKNPLGTVRVYFQVMGRADPLASEYPKGIKLVDQMIDLFEVTRTKLRETNDLTGVLAIETQMKKDIAPLLNELSEISSQIGAPTRLEKLPPDLSGHINTVRNSISQARQMLSIEHATRIKVEYELQRIVSVIQGNPSLSNLKVAFNFDKKSDLLVIDSNILPSVVQNTLVNAAEASATEVTITTASYPDHIQISIHDNGPGIPPEIIHRIFEPNFSTKNRGSGIGLDGVKQHVEKAGGRISVQSDQGANHGTTIIVEFPYYLLN